MKKILHLIVIIGMMMLSNFKVNGQANALTHQRTSSSWYLGWDNTSTSYGPLDIKNDINNSGTTYNIDFYIDANKFLQVLTGGDLNVVQSTNGYQINNNYVLWY
ncbi:MAG: hypothetical protein ABI855_08240, partial [Bacteroidota bacterium]